MSQASSFAFGFLLFEESFFFRNFVKSIREVITERLLEREMNRTWKTRKLNQSLCYTCVVGLVPTEKVQM